MSSFDIESVQGHSVDW